MLGNLVEDRTAAGWQPGGPALYVARTLANLGAQVTLVTNRPADYDPEALAGLDIIGKSSSIATRFENLYTAGGREQRLLAPGDSISELPSLVADLDALVFAPVYHELDDLLARPGTLARKAGGLFFLLQGTLRQAHPSGRVAQCDDPRSSLAGVVPARAWALYSREDTADPEDLARWLSGRGVNVVLTRDVEGACLYQGNQVRAFEAAAAHALDLTGAGDCFAAAFVVRLLETGDADLAMRFGLAAGAVTVEGSGLAGVPTRAAIEARLSGVPA